MNADVQTTAEERATWYSFYGFNPDDIPKPTVERIRRLITHVDALSTQNGELTTALGRIKRDKCHCGYSDPDDGEECAHDIARAALSDEPVDTEAERVRDKELRARLCTGCADGLPFIAPGVHYVTPDVTSLCAALSGEAGDTEAERVRERARERRG